MEEGKNCFKLLREKYGLQPDSEHYVFYIDILGRAGNIEEVRSTYHTMVEQGTGPTTGVWVALLNACSLNQDVERGELAAKHVLQLEPYKASNIVLVSNIYAATDRWDWVDELRSIMRTKGLVKEVGGGGGVGEKVEIWKREEERRRKRNGHKEEWTRAIYKIKIANIQRRVRYNRF